MKTLTIKKVPCIVYTGDNGIEVGEFIEDDYLPNETNSNYELRLISYTPSYHETEDMLSRIINVEVGDICFRVLGKTFIIPNKSEYSASRLNAIQSNETLVLSFDNNE